MITIALATSDRDIADSRNLMRRYAQWTGVDLCFQNFEAELAELPGKYVAPAGALWLATFDQSAEPVGVIAVRPIDDTVCEMKRLWVEPAAQGHGLGGRLARTAIGFARAAGFAEMKLDTLRERMPAAIALYRSLGFVETTPYTVNPEPDVLFMSLNLRAESP
jgi:ribosomal protein S18 acetylase RimI-like enzyme